MNSSFSAADAENDALTKRSSADAGARSDAGFDRNMFVIARCAKRAAAIQLDCFVAALLAMTARRFEVGLT